MRTACDSVAVALHTHGVRPPCLLTGDHAYLKSPPTPAH